MKKLIVMVFVSLCASAHAQLQGIDMQQFAMPTPCDFVAREISMAIVDSGQKRIPTERTDRYQQLRANPQYRDFNIPRLLAVGKDLEMDGASYQDVRAAMRIECNKQSRGK